ncbi:MAG: hypothetical protein QOI31_1772 [Solirubrobacterales bacterium]|nr:hypothetical protein [Solirubrobacterales bacterium]
MHTFRAFEVETGLGIAGLVAELALHTLDGEIRRIFTNHQMTELHAMLGATAQPRPIIFGSVGTSWMVTQAVPEPDVLPAESSSVIS